MLKKRSSLRIHRGAYVLLVSTVVSAFIVQVTQAQTKGGAAPAAKGAAPAAAKGGAAAGPPASLGQLMKGIIYPASNVIFAAQSANPAEVKPAKDASLAVNPLESSYGKWEAVENSALALAEAASLLSIPGRKCANGRPVPIQNADWPKFVQGLREAGVTVYKAAQTKNQDKIVDAADVMTTACSNCHEKYREVADRCK